MESDSDSESVTSNDSSVPEEEEEITDNERASIREKISTMSFEDLQKLKQQIGSKEYNKTVFGVSKKKSTAEFKRENKNRPREVSSKIRVRSKQKIAPVKKVLPRDPRFDPLCGVYDEKMFKSNYKFLKDVKKKEKIQLEKEFKECEDPQRRMQIKFVMQRLDNQIREQEKKEEKDAKIKMEKREMREKIKHGEKPEFKKKSVRKIEDLINKYEELKKNNKLQKHLEKKNKKLQKKDKKQMKQVDDTF